VSEPVWLSKSAVIHLHDEGLAAFGGPIGIRDGGMLESALMRPQQQYAYAYERDIPHLAAAYGYGLAKNHPFVDGNKRAAFLAVGLFLLLNGFRLNASQPDATMTILRLAAGELTEVELASWIRGNSTTIGD